MLLTNNCCPALRTVWEDEVDIADLLDLVALAQVNSSIGMNLIDGEQAVAGKFMVALFI